MEKNRFSLVILFCATVFFCTPTISRALTINEIYPAPNSDSDEWVELYNDSGDTIDLSTYSLTDPTGKHINFESTSISGNGYVVATSKNVLNNTGDTVTLKNSSGDTVDSVIYPNSLNDKKSYARCPDGKDGNFAITETITRNQSNAGACQQNPTTPPTPPTNEPTAVSTTVPTEKSASPTDIPPTLPSYDNVYISEVMSYPKVGENEWVELYNGNNFPVTLANWHIDDIENGGSAPKSFSLDIAAKQYGVVTLTSAIFNNSGDSVRLLDINSVLKDSISYSTATAGNSIGKTLITGNTICEQLSTKGEVNGPCLTTANTSASATTTKSVTSTSPTTIPLKTAVIITTSVIKKTGKQPASSTQTIETNNTAVSPATEKTNSRVIGSVLGVSADSSSGTPDYVPLIKGFSASAYLIALLSLTLSVKRLVKKIRINYI